MNDQQITLLSGFITAFLVVLFTMPSLIKVARMKHLVDEPSEKRKLHQRSVPTIGGIIIFAAIIFSYALYFPTTWPDRVRDMEELRSLFHGFGEAATDFKYLLAAMVLLFFIGVKDDIVGFSPVKKLVGHFVVGSILVLLADIRIRSMHGIFGIYELPFATSVLFSFFVYIVLVNAFNLIDGVDGLAGGVGLIAALAFGTWLYLCGYALALTLLAFVLAGALLGFLVFNYHPARIFMGDSGSLIVGAILAVLAMKVVDHETGRMPAQLQHLPTPIFVMAVLVYPLVDTLRVFVVRMAHGNSPFMADRNHIHHRLLSLGLGQRGATALIYLYVLVIIALSLVTSKLQPNVGLLVLAVAAFAIAMLPFAWPKRRKA